MKYISTLLLFSILLSVGSALPSSAGPNANAYMVLHLTPTTGTDPCLFSTTLPGCQSMNEYVNAFGTPVYAYVFVQKGDAVAGIGGASFGISYDGTQGSGVDVLSWNLCADAQTSFNGWPATGSGLRVTWSPGNCQQRMTGTGDPFWDGGAAVIGYFYLTAADPGNLFLTAHPEEGKAEIIDCAGTADDIATQFPSHLGAAGFDGAGGYNPCYTMHVNPCVISGDAEIIAGSSGNFYETSALGTDILWEITGNGSIIGPDNQPTVNIQAGGPGSFTLVSSSGRGDYGGYVCSKVVSVEAAIPVVPTSWSGIKALYRSTTP